jgi:hypothetical protein
MPDDVAVHDSDDRQRRNDVPVDPQVIHQLSFDRVATTAERGIVHRPHSPSIPRTFSTQQHRRILSRILSRDPRGHDQCVALLRVNNDVQFAQRGVETLRRPGTGLVWLRRAIFAHRLAQPLQYRGDSSACS